MIMELTAEGLKPVQEVELEIGQVIWLDGYSGGRAAIFDKTSKGYRAIHLEEFEILYFNKWEIKPASRLFGIGWYYTPGDTISIEEVQEALSKVEEARRAREEKARKEIEMREKLIEQYKKDYSHLKQAKERPSATLAAKNIRIELKQAFPGHKFSVRTRRGTTSDSITISWTDGPTEKEVAKITSKYREGYFNSSIDLYEYHDDPFTRIFGGTDYIFLKREDTTWKS